MQSWDTKLKEQTKKTSNLLRLNNTLMLKIDTLNEGVSKIYKQITNEHLEEDCSIEKQHFDKILQTLSQNKIEQLHLQTELDNLKRKLSSTRGECECERWKSLYVKETQESNRLSLLNAKLLRDINELNSFRAQEEQHLKLFISDYLNVYRKLHIEMNQLKWSAAEKNSQETQRNNENKRDNSIKKRQTSTKKRKKQSLVQQPAKRSAIEQDLLKQIRVIVTLRENEHTQNNMIRKQMQQLNSQLLISQQTSRLCKAKLRQILLSN